jgi:hypothetical protein
VENAAFGHGNVFAGCGRAKGIRQSIVFCPSSNPPEEDFGSADAARYAHQEIVWRQFLADQVSVHTLDSSITIKRRQEQERGFPREQDLLHLTDRISDHRLKPRRLCHIGTRTLARAGDVWWEPLWTAATGLAAASPSSCATPGPRAHGSPPPARTARARAPPASPPPRPLRPPPPSTASPRASRCSRRCRGA